MEILAYRKKNAVITSNLESMDRQGEVQDSTVTNSVIYACCIML